MAIITPTTRADFISQYPPDSQIMRGGSNTFERVLRCPAWFMAELADRQVTWATREDYNDAVFSAKALVAMAKEM